MDDIRHALPEDSRRFMHQLRTDLRNRGYDLRTIQNLLGHSDVKTTEIYTHVVGCSALGVLSPLDKQ